MTSTKYIAIDPAGVAHKRSTESRTYTHTVVVSGGYQAALNSAKSRGWEKTERSNFDYYTRIAEGRSEFYPSKRWCALSPDRYTPEQIAEEDARLTVSDAAKVADAKARIEGHTADSYIEALRAARIARVEERKAAGDFDAWKNAGWCGRRDLAEKLAAKHRTDDYVVAILEAREA